jgi:hypothetical protein
MGEPMQEFAVASACNSVSGAIFNCFDVCRMRLQIQDGLGQAGTYRGLAHTMAKITREEGWLAMWTPGLGATMVREIFYGGCQFGTYGPIKKALGGGDDFGTKLQSSCLCGAAASTLGCPTDVVKVRLQCNSGRVDPTTGRFITGLFKGQLRPYRHGIDVCREVYGASGVGGFYQGLCPTVLRAVALTAGLLVSYDSFKEQAKKAGIAGEGFGLHVAGGAVSGLVAATTSAPFDLVKSRVQNDSKGKYRGVVDCLTQSVRHEGFMGLYHLRDKLS